METDKLETGFASMGMKVKEGGKKKSFGNPSHVFIGNEESLFHNQKRKGILPNVGGRGKEDEMRVINEEDTRSTFVLI